MEKWIYFLYNNSDAVLLFYSGIGSILIIIVALATQRKSFSGRIKNIILLLTIAVAVCFVCVLPTYLVDNKVHSDFDRLTQTKTYTVLAYRQQDMYKNDGKHTYYLIKTKEREKEIVIDKDDVFFDKQDKFADKKYKPGTVSGTYTEITYSKKLPQYQKEAFEKIIQLDNTNKKKAHYKLNITKYHSDKV